MSQIPGNDQSSVAGSASTPRSTGAVLGMVGALIGILILIVGGVCLARGAGGSGAGEQLADQVREDRIQAVYLTDGQVLFGDVRAGDGDWIELADGFLLRKGDPATSEKNDEQAQTQLEVVPLSGNVGSDGDRLINATEVLSVENLAADSPIAERIEDARD